jgi:glutamate-5-semialdehyde dehydrogenase
MEYSESFRSAQQASRVLASIDRNKVNKILLELAHETEKSESFLLNENQKDLERMPVTDPRYDRLLLSPQRIKDIATEIRNVATLESPLGAILEERTLPNGMHLSKISVPLGVIGIIYESRPNVTFDVFSLCFKTGNACVLKGGSDAAFSNKAIVEIIHKVLKKNNVDVNSLVLLPATREATSALLQATEYIDIIIPRGSKQLIDYVREHARVPVIETGAGIVHVYFDESGDVEKGAAIVYNAKTRRVSVCNALDCLIVHKSRLNDLILLVKQLAEKNVMIYADEQSFNSIQNYYPAELLKPADGGHFGTEFLDYKMAIKTVDSINEGIAHIYQYSSKHSECIVAEDTQALSRFTNEIDAAVVYKNVSTAFTDGAQFGMGAEIGISTQKLHARGPMALKEITAYKWIVSGDGQVRK